MDKRRSEVSTVITELDKEYVAGTYKRFPIELVSGKGSLICGSDGREYIDLGSGIGVTSFGLCDSEWTEAVCSQATRLQHVSNLYYTEPCARLAEMLCKKTGMGKVFFSNSGAEANECAIKFARKYAAEKRGEDCFNVITLENSFHGRTLTTLSATGQDHYHELFRPLTPGFVHVKANDSEGFLKTAAESNPAAVMIECVQGEGGVVPLEQEFVKTVADYAKKNDVALIIDEVQTGNGRTGKLYSYMHYGIEPDIVSTAKGLAGGLPLGATLVSRKYGNVLGYGDHGSTFGGNPVSCAGALSILGRIDDELLEKVRRKSAAVFGLLKGAPGVTDVRGLGLMIGIKTERPASEVVAECLDRGVLCLTAKDRVRLLPALNIPDDLLAKAVKIIIEVCSKVS
ncbi:MAG: acetylornithine/succinylornithine family transaminase [Clostridia bacterium]|nr:acetylornithine/succinylornithine family transaminase [Clostridia bacterium]